MSPARPDPRAAPPARPDPVDDGTAATLSLAAAVRRLVWVVIGFAVLVGAVVAFLGWTNHETQRRADARDARSRAVLDRRQANIDDLVAANRAQAAVARTSTELLGLGLSLIDPNTDRAAVGQQIAQLNERLAAERAEAERTQARLDSNPPPGASSPTTTRAGPRGSSAPPSTAPRPGPTSPGPGPSTPPATRPPAGPPPLVQLPPLTVCLPPRVAGVCVRTGPT